MNFMELLNKRYSCRHFTEEPVTRQDLIDLMEAGRLSPSACNAQRWMFIAVDDPEKVRVIGESMYDEVNGVNSFTANVPAFIVILKHPVRNPSPLQQALCLPENYKVYIDIGIATENICLAATDKGLGTTIIGAFQQDIMRDILDLPDGLEVAICIAIGHPTKDRNPRHSRLATEDLFRFNSYNQKD